MDDDRGALGALDEDQCRALLETVTLGRLALSVRALPVVLPVDYVVDAARLILCIGAGPEVDAACDGMVVAFQVDGFDLSGETSWTVMVQGRARVLQAPDELTWAQRALSPGWADPLLANTYASVGMDLVTGHRRGRGQFVSGLGATGPEGPGRPLEPVNRPAGS